MKKVKTRHKETGKIEIFDEFVAKHNSSLEIIEEGDHLEEEQELPKLKDKEELRAARRRRKMRARQQGKSKKGSRKKRQSKRLGYGEDEGEDQSIRLRG